MSNKKRSKDKRRRTRRNSRATYKNKGGAVDQKSDIISSHMIKRLDCTVAKVDSDLGLVFGWAIVCTEDGAPYVDLGDDWIPDSVMLKVSTTYAKGRRTGGDMHQVGDGFIVHTMPLTAEIAKAFGIECNKTGLMIAMEPFPETMKLFKSGERTGFSIGGRRIKDTEITL